MKKAFAILLALLLCCSLAACKENKQVNNNATQQLSAEQQCTEQDIRMLVERNIDCCYLFYISPLGGDGVDSDGYSKADTSFFANYEELKDFVESTYTAEKSDYLLNAYPSNEKPLYKERNGNIYVDLNAVEPFDYNIVWDESYTVSFNENTSNKCSFTLSTTDFNGTPYVANGEAVLENGKWLLTEIVY